MAGDLGQPGGAEQAALLDPLQELFTLVVLPQTELGVHSRRIAAPAARLINEGRRKACGKAITKAANGRPRPWPCVLLTRRCGPLDPPTIARNEALPLEQLAEGLLDFSGASDLQDWLSQLEM